jgi:hypothetical protein
MAKEVGEEASLCVSQVHEECGANPEDEYMMDWFNNMKGRETSRNVPGVSCDQGCMDSLRSGDLQTQPGFPAESVADAANSPSPIPPLGAAF